MSLEVLMFRNLTCRSACLVGFTALMLFGMVGVKPSNAATVITVTATADDALANGNCTLREAVAAANTDQPVDACPAGSGTDTIRLAASTYPITLGELTISTQMTVIGKARAGSVIAGDLTADTGPAMFHVLVSGNLTASNLTVSDSYSAFLNYGKLVLSKVTVSQSKHEWISNLFAANGLDNHGTAKATNTLFVNDGDGIGFYEFGASNVAGSIGSKTTLSNVQIQTVGGGFYAPDFAVKSAGTMTLTNVLFDGAGRGDYGGAMGLFNSGTFTATALTIINGGPAYGPGISVVNTGIAKFSRLNIDGADGVANGGTLSMTDSSIQHVYGGRSNGRLIDNSGTITLTRTTIANTYTNTGAIYNTGTASLLNVTLANNIGQFDLYADVAFEGAGAIDNYGTVTIRNSTIVGNSFEGDGSITSQSSGGVVTHSGATTTMSNSILANNIAGVDGLIANDCNGTIQSLDYNLIEDIQGCTITGVQTGNIFGSDPLLGPLQDNGGKSLTMMPTVGSPTIDSGNPATPSMAAARCAPTDQRNIKRPRDGDLDTIARCDIGAVEV